MGHAVLHKHCRPWSDVDSDQGLYCFPLIQQHVRHFNCKQNYNNKSHRMHACIHKCMHTYMYIFMYGWHARTHPPTDRPTDRPTYAVRACMRVWVYASVHEFLRVMLFVLYTYMRASSSMPRTSCAPPKSYQNPVRPSAHPNQDLYCSYMISCPFVIWAVSH